MLCGLRILLVVFLCAVSQPVDNLLVMALDATDGAWSNMHLVVHSCSKPVLVVHLLYFWLFLNEKKFSF